MLIKNLVIKNLMIKMDLHLKDQYLQRVKIQKNHMNQMMRKRKRKMKLWKNLKQMLELRQRKEKE